MSFSAERAYYERWQRQYDASLPAHEWLAKSGGLATSMSEVFMAGYQGAMRSEFGVANGQWAAFCVSEGADGLPPVRQDADGLVSGVKTWVAAASVVDVLWVKVGRGADAAYVCLPRDTQGLSLTLSASSDFLPELCIGRLHLDRVDPGVPQLLSRQRLKAFPRVEAGCMLIALLGFLVQHDINWAQQELDSKGGLIIADRNPAALFELALKVQQCEPDLAEKMPNWVRDRQLIDMYVSMLCKQDP